MSTAAGTMDKFGVHHYVPGLIVYDPASDCGPQTTSITKTAVDGSGLSVTVSAGATSAVVTTPSGQTYTAPVGSPKWQRTQQRRKWQRNNHQHQRAVLRHAECDHSGPHCRRIRNPSQSPHLHVYSPKWCERCLHHEVYEQNREDVFSLLHTIKPIKLILPIKPIIPIQPVQPVLPIRPIQPGPIKPTRPRSGHRRDKKRASRKRLWPREGPSASRRATSKPWKK